MKSAVRTESRQDTHSAVAIENRGQTAVSAESLCVHWEFGVAGWIDEPDSRCPNDSERDKIRRRYPSPAGTGRIRITVQANLNRRDVIVIGGSAGGAEALYALLPGLPAQLSAALFILLHRTWRSPYPDPFPEFVAKKADLTIHSAAEGQPIEAGNIYIAPPESEMFLESDRIRIRPSTVAQLFRGGIDTLFRSAAATFGSRVVAVLLSGMMSDGREGLWEVRKSGGITIVQDPRTANYPDLPRNAIADIPVHFCLPSPQIAEKLIELIAQISQPEDASAPSARVLIVEDERIVAMNLENRLRELGYTVAGSVASAEEALTSVGGATPDLVLMDICLTGKMKGTDAGRALWERYHLPIVYLTAYADEKTLRDSKLSMPYGYIVKPYRPAQVHAAIQIALEQHRRQYPSS
jgi:chemotaxis response regulator CheB